MVLKTCWECENWRAGRYNIHCKLGNEKYEFEGVHSTFVGGQSVVLVFDRLWASEQVFSLREKGAAKLSNVLALRFECVAAVVRHFLQLVFNDHKRTLELNFTMLQKRAGRNRMHTQFNKFYAVDKIITRV